ncbi:MAG: aminotransferase class IV [Chitinophagaceae bacterium]|nr:aminotransferase class IV [Chitinophagaceae bacterium]
MAVKGWLNLNGSLFDEKLPALRADNRAFRYGDGLFETMKVVVGAIRLKELHFSRLFSGMETLQIVLPGFISEDIFTDEISRTLRRNHISGPARVRLTVYRGDGGLYDFKSASAGYVIQVWPISSSSLAMNEHGLRLGLFEDGRKSVDTFANLKSNNYLLYAMGAIHARKNHFGDSLILNTHGRVCDTTVANVFWVSGGTIFTPPLSEGCVAGVMRNYLISRLPELSYTVMEKELHADELLEADEVFLTNAISGLKWVGEFKNKKYTNTVSSKIFQLTI